MPRPGREARALLAEAATLQSLAATTLNRPEEARGQARSAYDAAVREIVAAQLASMPMARLKETTEGRVRLGAVEAAGLTTVASVMRAGPQRLQGIRGVGPETATKLVAAARVVGKKRVTSRKRGFVQTRVPGLLTPVWRWSGFRIDGGRRNFALSDLRERPVWRSAHGFVPSPRILRTFSLARLRQVTRFFRP